MAQDITIKQGKTFTLVIRAECPPVIRKAIAGVSFASGAPVITTTAPHGVTDGWRGYVTRVAGPRQLNAQNNPVKAADFHPMTVVNGTAVEFNDVTPVDEQGNQWADYVSGGFLEFYTPVDLAGKTARMQIRSKPDKASTLLASSEAADAPKDVLVLAVDNNAKTITLSIAATATDDFDWKTGYYDVELVGPTPADVLEVASGKITLSKELTV